MESDVAYVRHQDDYSGLNDSSVFDQRYSAHQEVPDAYSGYNLEQSVAVAATNQEPYYANSELRPDGVTVLAHVLASYCLFIVGPIAVFLWGHQTVFFQHHAVQGLFVTPFLLLIPICFVWNWKACLALWVLSLIVMAALTIKAVIDSKELHCFKLPLLGNWAYGVAEKRARSARQR